MDIIKRNLLYSPSESDKALLIKKSYPYKNKMDYVKKWQQDVLEQGATLESNQSHCQSFYSIYFPTEKQKK